MAKAGAAEKGVPLYKHIADLAGNTKLVSQKLAALSEISFVRHYKLVMVPGKRLCLCTHASLA